MVSAFCRKSGHVRITAQLIRVSDDTHLWSETYDRELKDVFAIQEGISNAIVDKLKVQLLGGEHRVLIRPYTANMEARNECPCLY